MFYYMIYNNRIQYIPKILTSFSVGSVFLYWIISFIILYICSNTIVFAQNNQDPVLRLDVELESLYQAAKDSGDDIYMVENVESWRDIFSSMIDHQLLDIYDDSIVLNKLYTHINSATPFCREGKLYDYEWDVYQHWDEIWKEWTDVNITPDYVSSVFGDTDAWYGVKSVLSVLKAYDSNVVLEKDDSFAEACVWIVACESGVAPIPVEQKNTYSLLSPAQRELNKLTPRYDVKTDQNCISYIQELYEYYDNLQRTANKLHVYQNLDNYYNGKTWNDWDNTSFDVRTWFESIWNMYSAYLWELDVLDFYPSNISEDKLIDPLDTDQALINTQWQDPFLPLNKDGETIEDMSPQERVDIYNPSPWIPTTETPTQKTAEYTTRDADMWWWLAMIWPATGEWIAGQRSLTNSRALFIPKTWPLNSLVQQSVSVTDPWWGTAIIQPDLCVEEVIIPQEIPADILEESIAVREAKKTYADALDTWERVSEVLRNQKNLTNEEKVDVTFYDLPLIEREELIEEVITFTQNNLPIDPADSDQDGRSWLDDIQEKMRACVEQYTDEDPDGVLQQVKKAMMTTPPLLECIQKLLCKEFTDPSGLGLATFRICTIPAQSVKQNNIQQVSSLHEVLDAHLNIATSMKNSGSLMRHVKTKEFLAFKTLELDFSEMFSFSINTSSKSPKTTKNPKIEAAILEENQKDLAEAILWKPNNKYDQTWLDRTMFFYSPSLDKAVSEYALTDDDIQNNIQQANLFQNSLDVDPAIISNDYNQQLLAEKQLYTVEYFDRANNYFLPSLADEIEDIRNTFNMKYDELR